MVNKKKDTMRVILSQIHHGSPTQPLAAGLDLSRIRSIALLGPESIYV
jgi:hypothetical protein